MAIACAIALNGCASAEKKSSSPDVPAPQPSAASSAQGSGEFGPPEAFGPPDPPSADATNTTYGPEPIQFRPVVLVLGPGLARGFAYAGAIRALVEAKIPIGAILGTEMGAFIGSLYAMDAKINRFEWAILKFKEGAFEGQSGGLMPEVFKRSSRAKKLEEGLASVFEKKDLSQSKLPVRVSVQMKDSAQATLLDRGIAATAIRAAVGDPELFGAANLNGSTATSASKVRPLLIAEARAMNLGPVVVIDALDEKDEKKWVSANELREADLVIRPNLSGIGPMDFHRKTDAAFRGKSAVTSQIAEIRHLVGMPNP